MPTAHACRLPAVPSAEGRTAERVWSGSRWHVSEQNIDQKDQLLLCFKIDPTVKRSSVTDKEVSDSKIRTCVQIPPSQNLGERAKRFHGLSRFTFARNDLLFTMSDNTRASFLSETPRAD